MFGSIAKGRRGTAMLVPLTVVAMLLLPVRTAGQSATVTDDAFLSANSLVQQLNLNGLGVSLVVAGSSETVDGVHAGATTTYIKFQLQSSLPPSVTSPNVAHATLKLFVSPGTHSTGAIDIYPITSDWAESTLSNSSPPSLAPTPFATGINVVDANSFLVVDVTQLVREWLTDPANGGLVNDGIALVADTNSTYVVFDSKENLFTSHEPRLEIVLVDSGPQGPPGPHGPAGPPGRGTVTEVDSGPGLIGGPITTAGTLSLDTSFTNSLYPSLVGSNVFNGDQTIFGAFKATASPAGSPYPPNVINLTSHTSGDAVQITSGSVVGQVLHTICTLGPGTDCDGIVSQGTELGGLFTGVTGIGAIGGLAGTGLAGVFHGDVNISGTLTKGAGAFKIDHPLDPANKYLTHSFVESPDMMNIYNGTILLDSSGEAWVTLPDWFEALNRDFRYQLTAMGVPSPNLYIAVEISGNRFKIAGGQPGAKVSWQVTGIRHDAYAEAHRLPVEEDKPAEDRGYYLHPEIHGRAAEKNIFSKHLSLKKHEAGALAQDQHQ